MSTRGVREEGGEPVEIDDVSLCSASAVGTKEEGEIEAVKTALERIDKVDEGTKRMPFQKGITHCDNE